MEIAEQALTPEIWQRLISEVGWEDAEIVALNLLSNTGFRYENNVLIGMSESQTLPGLVFRIEALDELGHAVTLHCFELQKIGPISFQHELTPQAEFRRDQIEIFFGQFDKLGTLCRRVDIEVRECRIRSSKRVADA